MFFRFERVFLLTSIPNFVDSAGRRLQLLQFFWVPFERAMFDYIPDGFAICSLLLPLSTRVNRKLRSVQLILYRAARSCVYYELYRKTMGSLRQYGIRDRNFYDDYILIHFWIKTEQQCMTRMQKIVIRMERHEIWNDRGVVYDNVEIEFLILFVLVLFSYCACGAHNCRIEVIIFITIFECFQSSKSLGCRLIAATANKFCRIVPRESLIISILFRAFHWIT